MYFQFVLAKIHRDAELQSKIPDVGLGSRDIELAKPVFQRHDNARYRFIYHHAVDGKPAQGLAAILGFGRALGDTLISLMLAGNAPQVLSSPWDSIRTLTAHIALVLATDSQSMAYRSVFAAGLLLFLLMATGNLLVRLLDRSFGKSRHEEPC